jgi:hypothetical protein
MEKNPHDMVTEIVEHNENPIALAQPQPIPEGRNQGNIIPPPFFPHRETLA